VRWSRASPAQQHSLLLQTHMPGGCGNALLLGFDWLSLNLLAAHITPCLAMAACNSLLLHAHHSADDDSTDNGCKTAGWKTANL
jgi:hypothetical protein